MFAYLIKAAIRVSDVTTKYSMNLKAKRWDIKKEIELIKLWNEKNIYRFNVDSTKPIFSIDTPPPYASGRPHIGFAWHYSAIDSIARYMRMKGYEVLFPMGIDRNGLPIEVQVEKKYNIRMYEYPREKFIELCRNLLDEYEKELLDLCTRLGFSNNSLKPDEVYRTDSPEYRALTQATFIEAFKKGLIYEDYRPNNYCPRCRTTIADAEVEYIEEITDLVYIRFPLVNGGVITVATTRPEMLAACQAILVHPDDARYRNLQNNEAIVPMYERRVKILPHREVNVNFGTGAMMLCSYGDETDVRLFRELQLTPIIIISENGVMTEAAGKYAGLHVKDARSKIVEDLTKAGYIERIEKIKHEIPVCWRCKTPIEFIPMKEFYLKQVEFLDSLREIIDQITFYPKESKQLLLNWINSVKSDWPISRRRYYGTEIPIWYCENGHIVLPEPGRYYRPWAEAPPFNECPYCKSKKFIPETRTFDTWMDSSISALYISGYKRDEKLFSKAFIVDLRPQGKEIVRTWLFYTILRTYQLTSKPAFKSVWISGLVMDEKGRKMSKSLGNIIYPGPLIEKYGADALRFAGAAEAKLGSDLFASESKIEAASKFIQKLYSIARFISAFPEPSRSEIELLALDEWIIAEANATLEKVIEYYDNFDFFAVNFVRNFAWYTFADHYIELVKSRAYGNVGNDKQQKAAWWTLHYVLKLVLKMLAPVTPFITDYIYHALYGKTIHLEAFPKVDKYNPELLNYTELIKETNARVWTLKKERKLPLNAPLKSVLIPIELKPFELDLKSAYVADKIEYFEAEGQIADKVSKVCIII